jgi:hypothetical protein
LCLNYRLTVSNPIFGLPATIQEAKNGVMSG